MSKLTGDALIWWRQHKREFEPFSSERRKDFADLQKGLLEQFTPPEYAMIIRTKLHLLSQTGSIKDYNTAFNRLVQQLPTASFEETSYDYLQGLREEVRNLVRTQYGLRMLRDLQQAALQLDPFQLQEESKPKRNKSAAYVVKDNKSPKSHTSRRRPPPRTPPRTPPSEIVCLYCKEKGHSACTCKKLCSILDQFHKGAAEGQERREEQAMVVKESIYLDSAVLSHMTNKDDWLEDYEDLQGVVKVRNGVKLDIKGRGSLPLSIKTENSTVDYKAVNVLYVPELSDTLISIGEIAKKGYKATFEGNTVKVQLESRDSFKVE